MVAVNVALKLIEKNAFLGNEKIIKLDKSLGFVIAEDIFSKMNMPPFRQSAMDGYAFIYNENSNFTLVGESKAGIKKTSLISKNEMVRIFTGAYVPDEVDTVVMQEHVNKTNEKITINNLPKKGANIREIGEQVKTGDQIAFKNTIINEATIGFLACLGVTNIKVIKKPKIAILITGNELVKVGKKLKTGQIYESNSVMLKSGLQRFNINKVKIKTIPDNLKKTENTISKVIKKYDFVLISGGISVGDYDFVKQGLEKNLVKEIFYKVNQKPGKPLFYGKKENCQIFALPGNPASSLTCFYLYVIPVLRKFMGFQNLHLPRENKLITKDFMNNSGKDLFLKAKSVGDNVTILENQSSAMLNSYSDSNVLVHIPENQTHIKSKTEIEVINLCF